MSLHKSFGKNKNLGGTRNVLNRIQRIKLLKERGLWKEGDKVTGLPKEKVIKQKKLKTEKKEKEEAADWDDIKNKE